MTNTVRANSTLVARVTTVVLAALGLSVALPACAEAGQIAGTIPAAASQIAYRAMHGCHFGGVPCGQHDPAAPGGDKRLDNRDLQVIDSARVATPANPIDTRFQSRLVAAPARTMELPIYARNCAYLEKPSSFVEPSVPTSSGRRQD